MPMWCVAPLEMNEGNSMGQAYNQPTGCSAEKAPHATFNFFLNKGVMALILIRLITLFVLHARTIVCTHTHTHTHI